MRPFRAAARSPSPRRNDPGFLQTEQLGVVAGRPTAGLFQCRAPIRGGVTPEPKAARIRPFRLR